jgi:CHASE2 domain-containing sensor protein
MVAEGSELLFDHSLENRLDDRPFADSVIGASGLYQQLLAAPRNPKVRYTALVEIDSQVDIPSVSSSNVCNERAFLARLIERINASHPAEIVIDKYFGKSSCPDDDAGTRDLIAAVQKTRANRPLIVGLATSDTEGKGPAVVQETLAFGPEDRAQQGIVNIAKDNRRLPLQWLVSQAAEGAPSAPVVIDTLSLAAAKGYEYDLLKTSPALVRLIDKGEQPFIGFIDQQRFDARHLYASEVVCGHRIARGQRWQDCLEPTPQPALRNKIVLVGENDRRADTHYSVVGKVLGLYLQANYIEALLDDRHYRTGGPIADYAFAFLFLLVLELILMVYHHEPARAVFLILVLLALSYATLYVVIMQIGLYVDPVPVGAGALMIKVLHLIYGMVQEPKEHGKHQHAANETNKVVS